MLQRNSIEIFTNVDHLLSFAFDLLKSLQGERSENVVRSYAERGEDPIFSVVGHQVMSFSEPNARPDHDHRAR